jgi:peroxiredoxin
MVTQQLKREQLMKILLLLLVALMTINSTQAQAKSLSVQLEEKAKASADKSPAEVKKVMEDAIEQLRLSQVMKAALKKDDKMPAFVLNDIKQGQVSSQELLKKGPLVIVFYRGGWCPYCNLQLRDLQLRMSEIKKAGANLVAISPEAPDRTADTIKKEELQFYVLSDTQGQVIKSFGLMFELSPDLIKIYKKFGINLDQHNAEKKWELPLAATYIVDKNGKIVYAFVDADYKKRAETTDLIKILKKL